MSTLKNHLLESIQEEHIVLEAEGTANTDNKNRLGSLFGSLLGGFGLFKKEKSGGESESEKAAEQVRAEESARKEKFRDKLSKMKDSIKAQAIKTRAELKKHNDERRFEMQEAILTARKEQLVKMQNAIKNGPKVLYSDNQVKAQLQQISKIAAGMDPNQRDAYDKYKTAVMMCLTEKREDGTVKVLSHDEAKAKLAQKFKDDPKLKEELMDELTSAGVKFNEDGDIDLAACDFESMQKEVMNVPVNYEKAEEIQQITNENLHKLEEIKQKQAKAVAAVDKDIARLKTISDVHAGKKGAKGLEGVPTTGGEGTESLTSMLNIADADDLKGKFNGSDGQLEEWKADNPYGITEAQYNTLTSETATADDKKKVYDDFIKSVNDAKKSRDNRAKALYETSSEELKSFIDNQEGDEGDIASKVAKAQTAKDSEKTEIEGQGHELQIVDPDTGEARTIPITKDTLATIESELKARDSEAQKAVTGKKDFERELAAAHEIEEENIKLDELDKTDEGKEYKDTIKKKKDNLGPGELYNENGERGYYAPKYVEGEEKGQKILIKGEYEFVKFPDNAEIGSDEIKEYEAGRKMSAMTALNDPDHPSRLPYSEGEGENRKFYKLERTVEDGKGVFKKVEVDKNGKKVEGGKTETVKPEQAAMIGVHDEAVTGQKEKIKKDVAAIFADVSAENPSDDQKKTQKAFKEWMNTSGLDPENEETLNTLKAEFDKAGVGASFDKFKEKFQKSMMDDEDWEDDSDNADDYDEDDEDLYINGNDEGVEDDEETDPAKRKLTDPRKKYHKRKNKRTGKTTKNYYDKEGNSISQKDYQAAVKRYKELLKKKREQEATTTPPPETSSLDSLKANLLESLHKKTNKPNSLSNYIKEHTN